PFARWLPAGRLSVDFQKRDEIAFINFTAKGAKMHGAKFTISTRKQDAEKRWFNGRTRIIFKIIRVLFYISKNF
ncbi:MAG: hypothetical protein ACR2N3_03305, partial [Pyrinomonadaceae bacterium]